MINRNLKPLSALIFCLSLPLTILFVYLEVQTLAAIYLFLGFGSLFLVFAGIFLAFISSVKDLTSQEPSQ